MTAPYCKPAPCPTGKLRAAEAGQAANAKVKQYRPLILKLAKQACMDMTRGAWGARTKAGDAWYQSTVDDFWQEAFRIALEACDTFSPDLAGDRVTFGTYIRTAIQRGLQHHAWRCCSVVQSATFKDRSMSATIQHGADNDDDPGAMTFGDTVAWMPQGTTGNPHDPGWMEDQMLDALDMRGQLAPALAAIEAMPAGRDRDVLRMVYLDDFDAADIARSRGVTRKTAQRWIDQAKEKLQRICNDRRSDDPDPAMYGCGANSSPRQSVPRTFYPAPAGGFALSGITPPWWRQTPPIPDFYGCRVQDGAWTMLDYVPTLRGLQPTSEGDHVRSMPAPSQAAFRRAA